MFNKSLNSGSLFGNANTSTPTSTPTPATNTFQLPSKSGGVFGTTTNALNASSPSPAGSLFSNNQNNNSNINTNNNSNVGNPISFANQNTAINNKSLFKNNNNPAPSFFGNMQKGVSIDSNGSSLFSKPSNNNQLSSISNGGFGNANQLNSGGLFSQGTTQNKSSGLLTSNVSSNQPIGLFGNTQASSAGSSLNSGIDKALPNGNPPPSISSNPYGLNIGSGSIPFSNMPASITASLPTEKLHCKRSSGNSHDGRRNYSISSINSNSVLEDSTLPVSSQSNLIQKLSNRLNTGQNLSSTQGIFSPFQKRPWPMEDQGTLNKNGSHAVQINNKGAVLMKDLSDFSLKKGELSDLRKLKIDPTRSTAKRLKLLSGKAIQTKTHEAEPPEHNNVIIHQKTDLANTSSESPFTSINNNAAISPKSSIESTSDDLEKDTDVLGYWSTPTPDQLALLPKARLSAIPTFVIGRRGYGYITFNYDVDLTAFSDNFKEELFGKVVKFNPTKTVEVYPDESKKAAIGFGLNVPATITLENIYPVDKKTKKELKDGTKSDEIQALIKKLKNMRNMEFISYNPFGGVWTFKVNHFSIWGLINEEDAEVDGDEIIKKKNNSLKRTIIYPKNKRELAQSNKTQQSSVPGGFSPTNHILAKDNMTQNDLLRLHDQSHVDLNEDLAPWNKESVFDEKPYEPDVSEEDFQGLEAEPLLSTSNDWIEQLKLAGSNLRSIFVPSKDTANLEHNEVDLLFSHLDEGMQLEKKICNERRLKPRTFGRFANDMSILKKARDNKIGVQRVHLPSIIQSNVKVYHSIFNKHLQLSSITKREDNGYPKVKGNTLQFKDVADLSKTSECKFWRLCSALFDPVKLPYEVSNDTVKQSLLKKERHNALCSWIIGEVRSEIDAMIGASDNELDKIFFYLAKNDIISATKLAIRSQNGHLSILITLLGSNDPVVCLLASQQLDKWKSGGNKVDPRIARIYKLLTGDIIENKLNGEFSWMAWFGLNLYYGKIDEYSLEDLISRCMRFSPPKKDQIECVILKLFSVHSKPKSFLEEIKRASKFLKTPFLWYFVQIIRFHNIGKIPQDITDKLTFDLIAELRIAQQHEESILAACFLENDSAARQQIDSIVFHEIATFTDGGRQNILSLLKISPNLVHRSQALWDQFNADFLSQAQNLLKASCFKDAEQVIITQVAPKLIINSKVSRSDHDLKLLANLLASFPKDKMQRWNEGLGVFENYLNLMLEHNGDQKHIDCLIDGLIIMFEQNKHYTQMPVCCNIMSQKITAIYIEKHFNNMDDPVKRKLLGLPLGQPEKVYLKNLLSGVV